MKIACCKDGVLQALIVADNIEWCQQHLKQYDKFLDVTHFVDPTHTHQDLVDYLNTQNVVEQPYDSGN